MILTKSLALAGALVLTSAAFAQFTETENNETKATANAFAVTNGSTITGNTTGSSTAAGATSLDQFRLDFASAVPGIYRNQLVLTTAGTAGHTGFIRGFSQSAGVVNTSSDVQVQSSSTTTTPARFNQFYTFGAATSVYYRVTGATATTSDYTATLTQTAVTPTDIGSFAEGSITISTIGQTTADTDFTVLGSDFLPVGNYANDDNTTAGGGSGTGLQGILTRTYAAGTYYLAISNYNVAANIGAASDDRSTAAPVLDFAGSLLNSSSTSNVDIDFTVTDSSGTPVAVTALKTEAYGVNFYKFTVGQPVPEPATMAVLGLGALALIKRRRKSA